MVISKKQFAGLVVATCAIALTSLAGCASEGGGEGSDQTLTIGMNAGLVPAFEDYAEEFERTHPGWTVTVSPTPDAQADYIQQLVTSNLSGTTPDILFNFDTLNQTLAANQVLFDLGPWLEEGREGLSLDNFIPAFLDQYRVGDAITAIPVSADSGMLFYNADVFKKYGVDELPQPDWTYEDMYRVAAEITEKSGGEAYGIIAPIRDGTAFFTFYPVLRAYGSDLFDPQTERFVFANESGLRAWEELLRPYTEGFAVPYSTTTDFGAMFNSGQVAMQVTSSAAVGSLRTSMGDQDWNVQVLPEIDGHSTTGGGSYSLSISARSDNKEGAWIFLSWFYSTDGGMAAAQENGVVPPTRDGIENGSWRNDTDRAPTNLAAAIEYAVENAILPHAIPDDVQPKVTPALAKALENVIVGGQSIRDAYTAAQDELNALLEQ